MQRPSTKKKTKLLIGAALAIIVVVVVTSVALLYRPYTAASANLRLDDPENDVISNEETEFSGMIDVVHAELEVSEETLNITISVKGPVSDLVEGELAQWNTTIILDEGTTAYEVCAVKNSTQSAGYVVDMMNWTSKLCQVEFHANSLTLLVPIDELQSVKEVQWFIVTSFEKYSGDELIIAATDVAPDEGLQTSTLRE
jgi:archaellum component FlaF (FlaF/FlaG flagellin family)